MKINSRCLFFFLSFLFIFCLFCFVLFFLSLHNTFFSRVGEKIESINLFSAFCCGFHWGWNNERIWVMVILGDISTQKGGPLKLVNKFTYLGNSVSSTENDINTRLAKALTPIYRLSVIWKSSSGRIITAMGMHHMDAKKANGEKALRQLHRNATSCVEHVLETIPHKTAATTHHENYQS